MMSKQEIIGDVANKISSQKNPSKTGAHIDLRYHKQGFGSKIVSYADQMTPRRLENFANRARTI